MKKLNNLPGPLSQEQIIILYKQYQEGNIHAKEAILTNNIKLVLNIVFTKFNAPYFDKEELISVGLLGLTECIDKYDINKKVKFSTYATYCVKNKIISYIRKKESTNNNISIYDYLSTNIDDEETIESRLQDETIDIQLDYEKKEEKYFIRELVEQLPKQKKAIIKMYFGFNCKQHTLKEIGKELNISSQYVHVILKETLIELKELLLELQFKKTNI